MVRIFVASSLMEAHIIRTALAQYGIGARIRNEMLSSLAGAVPVTEVMAEVWVRAEQATEALSFIREALAQPVEPDENEQDGQLSLTHEVAIPSRGQVSLVDSTLSGELSITEPGDAAVLPEDPSGPRCPSCHEESPIGFEICWNCDTELPV